MTNTTFTPTKNKTQILFISDIHVPFHDKKALKAVYKKMTETKFDVVIFGGDILDFYSLSRYLKDPRRKETLQDELDEAFEIMSDIRKLAPRAKMYMLKGNHEMRLNTYLRSKAPELETMNYLKYENMLRLDELGIEFVESDTGLIIGDTRWMHGHLVAAASGQTVYKHLTKYGFQHQIVLGHCHRLSSVMSKRGDKYVMGIEAGCLCDLNPEYAASPDWAHGFVTGTLFKRNNRTVLKANWILDGKVIN